MTLLETLALLTLLATVGFGAFDIAYKIFNNKKWLPGSTRAIISCNWLIGKVLTVCQTALSLSVLYHSPAEIATAGLFFFFSQGHPPPAKSFTDAKQNRRFCRLKNRETSVILVFESAVYITAGGLHLSGLTSGRRTFLLCPRRSTAKGVMVYDAFGNFSSAHVACNCELRRFRCRMENF